MTHPTILDAPPTYRLTHYDRAWTSNRARNLFAVLARQARIPKMERVAVTVIPYLRVEEA